METESYNLNMQIRSRNLQIVNELGSDAALELVECFLETYRSFFLEVEYHLEQKDFNKLHNLGHSLKSNSLYFGLDELNSLAARLEVSALSKNEDDIHFLVDKFAMALPRGLEQLEKISEQLT